MNQQLSFDLEPRTLARRGNPVTSHDAAARVSEFASDHHDIILSVLRRQGPCTAHEIATYCCLDAHRILKRLGELETAGQAKVVRIGGIEQKRATPSGRSARVWFAV